MLLRIKTDTKFRDRYGRCATVTHDEKIILKLFTDTDCSGLRGQSRTGTIVITYSDENDIIGSLDRPHLMIFIIMESR